MERRPDAGLDLGGRPVGDDAPIGHEQDPVGELVGLLQVMGGEDHRLAAGGERPHGRPEAVATLDIEGHGRLVENQQVWVRHQGDGEADPLGLAAGQLVGSAPGDVGGSRQMEDLVDVEGVGVDRGDHRDQLPNRQVADQGSGLEHRPDRAGLDRLGRRETEN